jgi:hypothetical protein
MTTPDINKILKANPRSCTYGAPLGASNYVDSDTTRLYLQRIRPVDYDYAPDGTYWGFGSGTPPLWCAFDVEGEVRVYVRARTREQAMKEILNDYPETEGRFLK